MSRWQSAFDNHQFVLNLSSTRSALDNIEVPKADVTTVKEAARLSKALAYLEGIVEALDPDLFPLRRLDEVTAVMAACANEINAYSTTHEQAHLVAANDHMDGVLEAVKPFIPFVSKGSRAYARAIGEQARQISEHLERACDAIDASKIAIEERVSAAEASGLEIDEQLVRCRKATVDLAGSDDQEGLMQQAEAAVSDIEDSQNKINSFYNALFVEAEGKKSTKSLVDEAVSHVEEASDEAKSIVATSKKTISELKGFFDQVFGPAAEDGARTGGLSTDLELLRKKMIDFQSSQEKQYKALNEQIESLLPGATSAGLASAYREVKDSFEAPIKFFSKVFLWSIGVLVVGSLVLHVRSISLSSITFVDLRDIEVVLKSIFYKLPFYGPAVWLAYYATKRRSEYQRLQQEYAHKEALAKSYDSYRKQIEDLDLGSSDLMQKLLEHAIEAVSYNASKTLDGAHGDKMPAHRLLGEIERIVSTPGKKAAD